MCLNVVHVLLCDGVWCVTRCVLCMLLCACLFLNAFACFACGMLCDAVWLVFMCMLFVCWRVCCSDDVVCWCVFCVWVFVCLVCAVLCDVVWFVVVCLCVECLCV